MGLSQQVGADKLSTVYVTSAAIFMSISANISVSGVLLILTFQQCCTTLQV